MSKDELHTIRIHRHTVTLVKSYEQEILMRDLLIVLLECGR